MEYPPQCEHGKNKKQEKNTGTNSQAEYIYSVGRIIGKAAEALKAIPMSALLYCRETSIIVDFTLRQWHTMK